MASISYANPSASGDALGFESQLWAAADKMRGHMDASEYKHVVLGLIFRADFHPDLKADFILANPPFTMSDWGGENLGQDVRPAAAASPVGANSTRNQIGHEHKHKAEQTGACASARSMET